MVAQSRLKLHFFLNTVFFCYLYRRLAQYFKFCRLLLLLKWIPPTVVYMILTLKRDITQLYPEKLLKLTKCVLFLKFRIYQHLPTFF